MRSEVERVTLEEYLAGVDAIQAEAPAYRPGGDGSGGGCDCIGLTIGAIRRAGGTWKGIHGSNYAARNEVTYLLPVTSAADLCVGESVCKVRRPGDARYALPSRYARDPDRQDYYHWGVVRSVDPLRIVHCTSPGGVIVDTRLGKWSYRCWLKKVDQPGGAAIGGEIQPAEEAKPDRDGQAEGTVYGRMTVTADSGSTVKMRARPSASCRLYWDVPVGTVVEAGEMGDEWTAIRWRGHQGYMMNKYLIDGVVGTAAPNPAADANNSNPTIRQGSRGDAVVRLQLALRALKYDLEPDGIFGPMTRECVKTFQATHGLTVDGVVGPKTWAALG